DGPERRLDERQCPDPDTVYGATKLAGEVVLRAQSAQSPPQVVTLRFATIYAPGKGQGAAADGMRVGVLSDLIDAAIAGRSLRVDRGGERVADMTYVEDAAAGVVAAAAAPQAREPVYHIATGAARTPRQVAEAANRLFDGADVHFGPGTGYMGRDAVYG